MTTTTTGLDSTAIRACFPALSDDTVFFENAGGSQVPGIVIEAIRRYFVESYVQLGAGYPRSRRADATVAAAHQIVTRLMNAEDAGTVVFGSSTTQLAQMLARSYATRLEPGDEVVIMQNGHEANVGPWERLERHGAVVRTWAVDPGTHRSTLDGLASVLNDRTRLVAACHVSNLLGGIEDVPGLTRLAHAVGARVIVDGVAFAPHRAIDVAAWGVDWYVCSMYKLYGPHQAALYGRHDAFAELPHPNHFFIRPHDLPYAFEPGGPSHEACAGIAALAGYFAHLVDPGATPIEPDDLQALTAVPRTTFERAFDVMTNRELPLQSRILAYLNDHDRAAVIGPSSAGAERVSTISFVPTSRRASEVVAGVHAAGIAIRHGHMYAHRLCEALGIDLDEGVVRVSLVHYNTMDEVDRLIAVLDDVL